MKHLLDKLFKKSRVDNYVAWLMRWRYAVLALAMVVTALALWVDRGLGLNSSLLALLPGNTPSIQRLHAITSKVGGTGDFMVMIESPDATASRSYADSLLPLIKAFAWVDRASYSIADGIFKRNKLLYLPLADLQEVKRRVDRYTLAIRARHSPFNLGLEEDDEPSVPSPTLDLSDIEARHEGNSKAHILNISDDGRILIIVVRPKGVTSNIGFARSSYKDLSALLAEHPAASFGKDVSVSIGGTYRNRLDEYDTIIHDIVSSAAWGGFGILLLLLLYFRRPMALLVLAVPLMMSLAWTFALTRLFIGELNLITAFLVIILFGLGIDFGIHLLSRYQSARDQGVSLSEAMVVSLGRSGRASMLAAATTAAAFYILTFSDFLGFRHFGFIAGTGVLLAFVAFMLVFPALLLAVEGSWLWSVSLPWPGKQGSAVKKNLGRRSKSGLGSSLLSYKWILLVCGLLSAAGVALLPKVSFEQDFRNLRSRVQRTRDFNAKMRQVFDKARDPAAVLVADAAEAAHVADWIKKKVMVGKDSPVVAVKTLEDYLPHNQAEKLLLVQKIQKSLHLKSKRVRKKMPQHLKAMLPLLEASRVSGKDLPLEVQRPFLGLPNSQGQLVYVYQRNSLLDLRQARVFSDAVGHMTIAGKDFFALSEPIIYAKLVALLQRDSVIASVAAFLVLFWLVFVDLGSLRSSVLVLAPLVTGVIWMLGIMAWEGLRLNIFNMVVLPSILGLGIDAAVHIYHRVKENGVDNMWLTLKETGGAAAVSTATTMIGFGGLVSASHPGLQSIGILAVIGMGTSLLASLTLLPALLAVVKGKDS